MVNTGVRRNGRTASAACPAGSSPRPQGGGREAGRGEIAPGRASSVFVFNPFAEGAIARGKAFTPVQHQASLAADQANLPQFLCQPDDIVLVPRRPSDRLLNTLGRAGFPLPDFVELRDGRIDPASSLCRRELGSLRPWAWGPDSIHLFEPLFARVVDDVRAAKQCFNGGIARLYSKGWSAGFLRTVLARCRARHDASAAGAGIQSRPPAAAAELPLCSEQDAGVEVDTIEDALEAIAAIRHRGHHRVVVKEAYGLVGRNAIRLWEPEVLPAQRQWLACAIARGQTLVVEPWLERELDFSVQFEMGVSGLRLCGYAGLVNDRKGQFLANWAEADFSRCLPAGIVALFREPVDFSERLQRLYLEILAWLEPELQRVGFVGPIGIDAFVYRTPQGDCRLKPVVEINPRYTMGRLTLELMQHACPGSCGLFRLVTRVQARSEGFADLPGYAGCLGARLPPRLEGEPGRIRQGALCLNDPGRAHVCLATFEVRAALDLAGLASGNEHRRPG